MPSIMIASPVEYKGNIGFEGQYLHHDRADKRDNAFALRMEAEVKKEFGLGSVVAKAKGIWDKDDAHRRYIDFSDLYYTLEFDHGDLLLGRSTRFWGALEFYNLTDTFNTKDFLDDPFDYESKLGAWNVAYTHYFDEGDLSLIVKLHEERQRMQEMDSVNFFLPLAYHDSLSTQEGENRPSVYLKYSGSAQMLQLDYAFIYENGYDAQRYMRFFQGKLQQRAYIVNKLLGYGTLIVGDTIYKSEFTYALSEDDKVADYTQLGIGVEHTLYGVWEKKDLGLLMEYYRYDSDKESGYGAKDFSTFFANDLTLGFRLSMNDLSSSEILGGVDYDIDSKEKIYFVEYDTRLFDTYKLKGSYQHLSPSGSSVFSKLDRVKLEFGYYF